MKVALVHSYYSSKEPSGENAVVEAQAAVLRERGIKVLKISRSTDDQQDRFAHAMRAGVSVATGFGPSPIKALSSFKPDVVHVHNLFPNWGSDWLKRWEGPVVATVHNFRPICAAATLFRDGSDCRLCPERGSLNAVRHACYKGSTIASLPLAISTRGGVSANTLMQRAARVIVLSQRAEDIFRKFGTDPAKLVRIPNFVRNVSHSPTIAPNAPWVYIGRLTAEKGILGLLEGWPPEEKLIVYGDGPLKNKVLDMVSDCIEYGGLLPSHKVPQALQDSRGLIFPSEWAEGLPLIYLEALAAGRPVIAKSGNSAADDIIASQAGAVFGEWEQFQSALQRVRLNQNDLGHRARQNFERVYNETSWFNSTMSLYRSVLAEC